MPEPREDTSDPSSPQQQSWGAIIAIVVILAMIVIGAFYAWNKRVNTHPVSTVLPTISSTTTTY